MARQTFSTHDPSRIYAWIKEMQFVVDTDIPQSLPLQSPLNQLENLASKPDNVIQQLQEQLSDGVALCKLLNLLSPGAIKNINLSGMAFAKLDNINRFLAGCEYFLHIAPEDLFDANDLYQNENIELVLKLVYRLAVEAETRGIKPKISEIRVMDAIEDTEMRYQSVQVSVMDSKMVALYDYDAEKHDELSFKSGEELLVINKVEGGWWEGKRMLTGETGWFPSNYVGSARNRMSIIKPSSSTLSLREGGGVSDEQATMIVARNMFCREMVKAERDFSSGLTDFVENIVDYLAKIDHQKVFPATDHFIAFGRFYDLMIFHESLSAELESCLKRSNKEQLFSEVFRSNIPKLFEVYSEYCDQYSKSVRVMSKYKNDAAFSNCLREAYASPGSIKAGLAFANPPIINIMGWLVKPTQRMQKYGQILKELRKSTPDGHADAERLPDVQIKLEEALRQINTMKQSAERREVLADVSTRIENWEGPALEHYGELLMDGNLKVSIDGKMKERYFFLLAKILVCLIKTQEIGDEQPRYKLAERISFKLDNLACESIPDTSNAKNLFKMIFTQNDKKRIMMVSASTAEGKHMWLAQIKKASENLTYSFPSIPRDLSDEITQLPSEKKTSLKRFLSKRVAKGVDKMVGAVKNVLQPEGTDEPASMASASDATPTRGSKTLSRSKSLFGRKKQESESSIQTPTIAPQIPERTSFLSRSKSMKQHSYSKGAKETGTSLEETVGVSATPKNSTESLLKRSLSLKQAFSKKKTIATIPDEQQTSPPQVLKLPTTPEVSALEAKAMISSNPALVKAETLEVPVPAKQAVPELVKTYTPPVRAATIVTPPVQIQALEAKPVPEKSEVKAVSTESLNNREYQKVYYQKPVAPVLSVKVTSIHTSTPKIDPSDAEFTADSTTLYRERAHNENPIVTPTTPTNPESPFGDIKGLQSAVEKLAAENVGNRVSGRERKQSVPPPPIPLKDKNIEVKLAELKIKEAKRALSRANTRSPTVEKIEKDVVGQTASPSTERKYLLAKESEGKFLGLSKESLNSEARLSAPSLNVSGASKESLGPEKKSTDATLDRKATGPKESPSLNKKFSFPSELAGSPSDLPLHSPMSVSRSIPASETSTPSSTFGKSRAAPQVPPKKKMSVPVVSATRELDQKNLDTLMRNRSDSGSNMLAAIRKDRTPVTSPPTSMSNIAILKRSLMGSEGTLAGSIDNLQSPMTITELADRLRVLYKNETLNIDIASEMSTHDLQKMLVLVLQQHLALMDRIQNLETELKAKKPENP